MKDELIEYDALAIGDLIRESGGQEVKAMSGYGALCYAQETLEI